MSVINRKLVYFLEGILEKGIPLWVSIPFKSSDGTTQLIEGKIEGIESSLGATWLIGVPHFRFSMEGILTSYFQVGNSRRPLFHKSEEHNLYGLLTGTCAYRIRNFKDIEPGQTHVGAIHYGAYLRKGSYKIGAIHYGVVLRKGSYKDLNKELDSLRHIDMPSKIEVDDVDETHAILIYEAGEHLIRMIKHSSDTTIITTI